MGRGSPTSTSFLLQAVQPAQLLPTPFSDLLVQDQFLAIGRLTDVTLAAALRQLLTVRRRTGVAPRAGLQLEYRRQLLTVRRRTGVAPRAGLQLEYLGIVAQIELTPAFRAERDQLILADVVACCETALVSLVLRRDKVDDPNGRANGFARRGDRLRDATDERGAEQC